MKSNISIFLIVFVLLITSLVIAQIVIVNIVLIEDKTASRNTINVSVPVVLENTEAVAGFQFDIEYSPELTFKNIEPASRLSEQGVYIETNTSTPGVLKIAALAENEIAPGNGTILNLIFDVDAKAVPGEYPIPIYALIGNINANALDTNTVYGTFTIVADADEDGVPDEDDACLTTSGRVNYQGCPVGDLNILMLHVIDKPKTFCGSGSCKVPVEGAEARVFDRNDADFQTLFTKNPKATLYGKVFETDVGRIGSCITNKTGMCIAGEETVGEYLVIIKYVDNKTGTVVYIGRPKGPEDFKDSDDDGVIDLAQKDFQVIKTIIKDNDVDFKAGIKTVVTGSILEVIHPQYVIWENETTLYPFIFTSDSDWEVDVCVYVPEGYEVVNGECKRVFVANETRENLFTIMEVGSPEPDAEIVLNTKHEGKQKKITLSVPGKRTSQYLKARNKKISKKF